MNDRPRREYAVSRRMAVIALGGLFFLVVMPWLLATGGAGVDRALGFPRIGSGLVTLLVGWPLILIGLFFGIWSVSRLFSEGKGTPLPFMPTQELVVLPPYSYCRNPMAFGVFLYYLGFGLAIGSLGALVLAALFAVGLLFYIRATEEAGLEQRFGEGYREYRRRTPFLIPRIW